MIRYLIFFIIILLANIMQGITGFAGTILAMPFSLMLVGYPVAKPILNVLGLFSGIYVFAGFRKSVNWKEFLKIVIVMTTGIFIGIYIKGLFIGREQILYKCLGIFVIVLALRGLWTQLNQNGEVKEKKDSLLLYALLPAAGIVHGIFVSGGPLLIGYLSKKLKDKTVFRATISTSWIVLNGIVLADDLRTGLWTIDVAKAFLISIPFLFVGMKIGSVLYSKMSQKTFMIITYILLLVSGISLLIK